jgi:tRNA 2-thiouridine synthesizing protein E
MPHIEVNGKQIEVDEDGYIQKLEDWSEDVAKHIAKIEQVELTPEHWEIINFLRSYYQEYKIAPMIRILTKEIAKKMGPEKGNTKYLYSLFPAGPAKQACKIAGLAKPAGRVRRIAVLGPVSALRSSVRADRGDYPPCSSWSSPGGRRGRWCPALRPDELVRWRAVSALGHLAGAHPDLARPLVTRLLWTLNDESGGIGWMSAPALGEIGRRAPALLRDAVRVVVHYLDDPTLLPGVLWSIGRLAPAYPDETREVLPELVRRFSSSDPAVRAHAAVALGQVGDERGRAALDSLDADTAPAPVYREGELAVKPVRDWAREAAARLRGAGAPH